MGAELLLFPWFPVAGAGEIGIEAWIEEQEERAKAGFVYADIRCHPYDIPRE